MIPQRFIDDLLTRIDIVEVIDKRVRLKKTGRNYSACCPFHEEKTPSFSVNPEKQFYYCFGCGAGGNAISFLVDYERLEFPEAVTVLANHLGVEVPNDAPQNKEEHKEKQQILPTLEKACAFYRHQLKQHPQASNYLKKRGLTGLTAKDFLLGYAPSGWDNLLKTVTSDELHWLIQAGVITHKAQENKTFDFFRERIIFPIRNHAGKVVAFGGRVLNDDKPKYLNTPESSVCHKSHELYGLYEARKSNRQLQQLLVTEGYMDVVMLAQHGVRNAVATLGTAIQETHLQKIFRTVDEVVFCFDGDDAGRAAAKKALLAALPLMNDNRQARFFFLPEGEDPDSLVQKIGAESFTEQANNALPLSQFLFNAAGAVGEKNKIEDLTQFSQKSMAMINTLPEGVLQQLMLNELKARTGLSIDALKEATAAQKQQSSPQTYSQPTHSAQPPQAAANPIRHNPQTKLKIERTLAHYAIAMVLQQTTLALMADTPLDSLQESSDETIQALLQLIAVINDNPDISQERLWGLWHGTPTGTLFLQLAGEEKLIPENELAKAFPDIIQRLVKQQKKKQSELLWQELAKLKSVSYSELSQEQQSRLHLLTRQLTGKW